MGDIVKHDRTSRGGLIYFFLSSPQMLHLILKPFPGHIGNDGLKGWSGRNQEKIYGVHSKGLIGSC